jgi:succinyl-CoA synthetase beta subunit
LLKVLQIAIKEEKKDLTQAYSSLNKRRSVLKPQTVLVQRGKLSFIDLAGSERGADTNHASKQTRLEGELDCNLFC